MRPEWSGPLIVLLIAAGLRLAWAINLPIVPVSDGTIYDLFARRLAAGQGYTWESGAASARWPVGTSFVYSLVYRLAESPYGAIAALHIALALVLIGATMALAKRWFGR